jgi:hypothetical protein
VAFRISDDGRIEVDPDHGGDPVRKMNAELAERLAWHLEDALQADECNSAMNEANKLAIRALEARVAFLEQLLTAGAAA